LGHVDATLRLLNSSVDIEAIPNKRIIRRIKLFRQGELGRLILGALRDAEAPLSTQAITTHILAAGSTARQPGQTWPNACAETSPTLSGATKFALSTEASKGSAGHRACSVFPVLLHGNFIRLVKPPAQCCLGS
jgi:hypothetical protein